MSDQTDVEDLIEETNRPPEPVCPCCGHLLFPHRQKLVCSNAECPYEETCCEGPLPQLKDDRKSQKK